ncbi:hypothetical protein CFIMG_001546RA [Ceratocystis fimbriata CBS 114723]|uniref:Uncharacterized protein n=1 Tax=Ceratocystis fimbriata CBS 114723 TaxID=1035309 RepID=A0A2C5XBP0_9PEZI|nr:hypothetical protein CFIMG_001546RA [Ceratocystis fimbriata CBS 114723]
MLMPRKKITDYERPGVQASVEMQTAAWLVTEENRQLRQLLLRFVSGKEIETCLQGDQVQTNKWQQRPGGAQMQCILPPETASVERPLPVDSLLPRFTVARCKQSAPLPRASPLIFTVAKQYGNLDNWTHYSDHTQPRLLQWQTQSCYQRPPAPRVAPSPQLKRCLEEGLGDQHSSKGNPQKDTDTIGYYVKRLVSQEHPSLWVEKHHLQQQVNDNQSSSPSANTD